RIRWYAPPTARGHGSGLAASVRSAESVRLLGRALAVLPRLALIKGERMGERVAHALVGDAIAYHHRLNNRIVQHLVEAGLDSAPCVSAHDWPPRFRLLKRNR